jgi:CubicO group peptidase (beta-lactamase class C family)
MLRRSFVLVAVWLLSAAAARADEVAAKLDEYMSALTKLGRFSGSVLVAREGRVLLAKGYGLANAEWDIPNTPATKFRLGSVTKQFTALAIMQLDEKGKLKVEDPVSKYVAECPPAWRKITIHHLLTHTSGIPSFTSFPDYVATMNQRSPVSKTVERFKGKPLDFEPGEKFQYSNSGYVLLGYILEKVAEQEYGEYLEQNVFGPLKMRNSGYDSSAAILKQRASGYMRRAGNLANALYIDMTVPHAAGALYSTVEDLLLWDQALDTEKLVSKKSLERIFTPFKSDYAYGWFVAKKHNRKYIGHAGGINGFATMIERYPDGKVAVIVLSNVEGSAVGPAARDLAAIVFGEKYEMPGERKRP